MTVWDVGGFLVDVERIIQFKRLRHAGRFAPLSAVSADAGPIPFDAIASAVGDTPFMTHAQGRTVYDHVRSSPSATCPRARHCPRRGELRT